MNRRGVLFKLTPGGTMNQQNAQIFFDALTGEGFFKNLFLHIVQIGEIVRSHTTVSGNCRWLDFFSCKVARIQKSQGEKQHASKTDYAGRHGEIIFGIAE